MASIAKLGHVALVTPDMERSLWFWSEVVGLEEVQRTGDAAYLRGGLDYLEVSFVSP